VRVKEVRLWKMKQRRSLGLGLGIRATQDLLTQCNVVLEEVQSIA